MPRELSLGNGRLLVTFDASYTLRDIYYPHVGKENHTVGHPSRTGVWVDGTFAWLSDPGWSRTIGYRSDTLVSHVVLEHPQLGLRIAASDTVHPEETILLRDFRVTNLSDRKREIRLFFHHDFHISESEIGDTAYFEPVGGYLIHYKGHRYFLANGRTDDGAGIFQYATGTKETGNSEGTWRDAEDGRLEMNPIAQGSVDSVVSFRQTIGASDCASFHYWLAVEQGFWEVKALDQKVLGDGRPTLSAMVGESDAHWRSWIERAPAVNDDLPASVEAIYRRSLLVISTQVDHDGAIIAANDGDSMLFNRDTYSYMWPRDGALVARTLDLAGYTELTERFFRFCARLMPRPSYYPEGYLMHKFNADGSTGSSWHPWVRDGRPSLPIQEDETALVIWSFWNHFDHRPVDVEGEDLLRELAPRLVLPAARFMLAYRDIPEGRERFHANWAHPPTGLPLPSYDLWEERYGIHTFTVAATCAGLDACGRFLSLIAERGWAEDPGWRRSARLEDDAVRAQTGIAALADRCHGAASLMKGAMQAHLWCEERRSYARMLGVKEDGTFWMDKTLDAATMYALLAFGAFPHTDAKLKQTVRTIEQRLWCKTAIGGIARYENDYYHQKSDDIENVPGSPWFICTLWGALAHIALAESRPDLRRAREMLEWVCAHAQPSGVLAEQVHPYTGEPMSVSPLTWSHAAFVETVRAYCDRWVTLK